MRKTKKKKRKTIGKMTGEREMWKINPVTRVKQNKRINRKRVKERLKKGEYDDV